MNEETLNHLLTKARVLSVNLYSPTALHILFDNGAILIVNAGDYELAIDILGPSSPEVAELMELEEIP